MNTIGLFMNNTIISLFGKFVILKPDISIKIYQKKQG
jgi:hypothetical protein